MNLWSGRIKIWLGEATTGGFFSSGGWTKFWLMGEHLFQGMGSSPFKENPDFWFLLFKQATHIARVLTRPEKCHIMLLSPSALIPHLRLYFFQKLKYYTLGNNEYSRKLFCVVVAVNVNAKEIKGTVSFLVKTRVFISALMVSSWLLKLQFF